jgi:spermidine/putrescine ABC transporter ATP-binding subunit
MARAVQLVELTKEFGDVRAVDHLSLDIEEQEFVSLLGPSGCGKTTTLRMIAGLIEATSGRVYIRERDVSNVPPCDRNVGMVFQDYALFPHMTVHQNIAFGLQMHGVAEKEAQARVQEMLDLVHLPGVGDRRPAQLSGGQQQRIALARALAYEPTVLLLDEPLSNLDRKLRQDMRVELKRIQREVGVTTIFVTHDQAEALSLSDRVVVMRAGRIEQVGSPVELYENPRSGYVASFLGDVNFFHGHVKEGRLVGNDLELATPKLRHYEDQTLTIGVRSEKITVSDAPPSGPNEVSGTVETMIYLGSVRRCYIRLDSGQVITADLYETGCESYGEGSDVTVGWSAVDCIIIEEDADAQAYDYS